MAPNELPGSAAQGDGGGKPNQNPKNKDQYAEAGRRKLEEFRKKRAVGNTAAPKKLPTATTPPAQVSPASTPLAQVPTNHETVLPQEIPSPVRLLNPKALPPASASPSPPPPPLTTEPPLRSSLFTSPSTTISKGTPGPSPDNSSSASNASSANDGKQQGGYATMFSAGGGPNKASPSFLTPSPLGQAVDKPRASTPFASGPLFAATRPDKSSAFPGHSPLEQQRMRADNPDTARLPAMSPTPPMPSFRPPPLTFLNPLASTQHREKAMPPSFHVAPSSTAAAPGPEFSRASASLDAASPQATPFALQGLGRPITTSYATRTTMDSASASSSSTLPLPPTTSSTSSSNRGLFPALPSAPPPQIALPTDNGTVAAATAAAAASVSRTTMSGAEVPANNNSRQRASAEANPEPAMSGPAEPAKSASTSRASSLWSFVAPMPPSKQTTKPAVSNPLIRSADASRPTTSDTSQTSPEPPPPLPPPSQPSQPPPTSTAPPSKPLLNTPPVVTPPPISEPDVNNVQPNLPSAPTPPSALYEKVSGPLTAATLSAPPVVAAASPRLPAPSEAPKPTAPNDDTWRPPVPASSAFGAPTRTPAADSTTTTIDNNKNSNNSSSSSDNNNNDNNKNKSNREDNSDNRNSNSKVAAVPSKDTSAPPSTSNTRPLPPPVLKPPAPPAASTGITTAGSAKPSAQKPVLPPPPPALSRDASPKLPKPTLQPSPLRPSFLPSPLPSKAATDKKTTEPQRRSSGGGSAGGPGFDFVGLLSAGQADGVELQPPQPPAAVVPAGAAASAIAARGAEVDRSRQRGELPPPPMQTALPPSRGEKPTAGAAGKEGNGPVMNGKGRGGGGALWGSEFGALEQHIEDLTQEKYALQRGLDAARTLAESLASENEALTETFNRQGQVVAQLQAEIDRLGEEIQAQKVVVEAAQQERERAVGESAANAERSRALASENVALEEKILRLRSNELKLERDIQSLKVEIEGGKRTVAMMDKDRSSMRSTIENLQEDKRALHVRLRKAALGEVLESVRGPQVNRAEASTSTDDLVPPTPSAPPTPAATPVGQAAETSAGGALPSPSISRTIPLEEPSASFSTEVRPSPGSGAAEPRPDLVPQRSLGGRVRSNSFSIADLSAIPEDEARTIESINRLITELTEERRAVHVALQAEVASSAELRTANAELSRKLAVQTQRLELAVAQNMARQSNGESSSQTPREEDVLDYTPEYMDENDEVVERVLGWIMRLIPGGSSKRSEKRA